MRTSSLRHTVMFSVLVFVTLLCLVCSTSSHCDGQCARSSLRHTVMVSARGLRHTVMVSVHKNARDNVSTIYVLNYCTHLLMVRDRRDRNISLNLFYLRDLHGTTQRTLYAE